MNIKNNKFVINFPCDCIYRLFCNNNIGKYKYFLLVTDINRGVIVDVSKGKVYQVKAGSITLPLYLSHDLVFDSWRLIMFIILYED